MNYEKSMVVWTIANGIVMAVGLIGYLWYNPVQIEADDFFGTLFGLSLIYTLIECMVWIANVPDIF